MVDTIIEAAARILETRGLAGFNTNAVAERAGVSVGSLHQYFPNKEALVAALSARERARLAADIEAANRPAADLAPARLSLEESLRRLVRAAIRRQLARPGLARVLDFEEQRLVLDDSDRAATRSIAGEVATVLNAHRRRLRLADCEEAAFEPGGRAGCLPRNRAVIGGGAPSYGAEGEGLRQGPSDSDVGTSPTSPEALPHRPCGPPPPITGEGTCNRANVAP